jgi:hypothetical protein
MEIAGADEPSSCGHRSISRGSKQVSVSDAKKLKVQVPTCQSARQVSAAFKDLDFEVVSSWFNKEKEENDFVDAEPFLVCKVDSLRVFNRYSESEQLRIALGFLEVKDDQVFIIDWPSRPHESAVRNFESKFYRACGDEDAFGKGGSFTTHRDGNPSKEAVATVGPLGDTPNRTDPPEGRSIADWVTLAVEVAVSQDFSSLERAAHWWAFYPGVKYVLCIKLSPQARRWRYRLYEIDHVGVLPDARFDSKFSVDTVQAGVHVIALDTRKILSIPDDMPASRSQCSHRR